MVELPCLASQCVKLHVAGWKWAVFTRVYLESCTWPVANFTMDQRRNSECASNFVPILGKVLRIPSKWFNKASGTKSWVVHRYFNGIPGSRPVAHQLTTTNTQGDPQVAKLLKQLHEFNSSSVRIDVGPFATLLRRWELVMGHANGFWWKNWACTVSQPNLCPGSWRLTRSSSASASALNVVSSPPTMKRSWPGSSLLMRAGFTVTTLRHSDNPPSGKAPRHQGQKRPDKWKAISRAWLSLSLTPRGLCTKNLSQQTKLWVPGSTAKFCGDCMKTYEDIAPNFGENRPCCFTMSTPRLTLPSSPTSFWRKTKFLLSPTHRTPLIWHPVTSSYSQNWNWSWKDAGLIPLRRYRPNGRECLTPWQKRTFKKRSKNGGDGGTDVYMREGTTSRVTAADRPYCEFYDFYSVSPETFGSTQLYITMYRSLNVKVGNV